MGHIARVRISVNLTKRGCILLFSIRKNINSKENSTVLNKIVKEVKGLNPRFDSADITGIVALRNGFCGLAFTPVFNQRLQSAIIVLSVKKRVTRGEVLTSLSRPQSGNMSEYSG